MQESCENINKAKTCRWYEGKKNNDLQILQRCLDHYDKNEINKVLMEYTRKLSL